MKATLDRLDTDDGWVITVPDDVFRQSTINGHPPDPSDWNNAFPWAMGLILIGVSSPMLPLAVYRNAEALANNASQREVS
ncbi:MAG: hypothetical protein AAF668_13985 [Pseudomonadota bacterium]